MTDVHVIAGERVRVPHRIAADLAAEYGDSAAEWAKKVGKIDSARYVFDAHWVEHPVIGRLGYKSSVKERGRR